MRAHLVRRPGGPEVLELVELPDPEPADGWVLIEIAAFGLNRAEAVTRAGGSGDAVPFPKVIGIEAIGTVVDGGGTDLQPGQLVAAAMGGLGREHHGSYAEKTLARRTNVFALHSDLDPVTLAAIPETWFTAMGCLDVLGATGRPGNVVVRPGASALGRAIAQLVRADGGETIAVTRSAHKRQALLDGGFGHVIVGDGPVADEVRGLWPAGADGVVDTIASAISLSDDLALLGGEGRLCVAGSLADSYGTAATGGGDVFDRANVGFYSSETLDQTVDTPRLQRVVDGVADGTYAVNIAEVVGFEEVVDAHRRMEANAFAGKVVVDLSSTAG